MCNEGQYFTVVETDYYTILSVHYPFLIRIHIFPRCAQLFATVTKILVDQMLK